MFILDTLTQKRHYPEDWEEYNYNGHVYDLVISWDSWAKEFLVLGLYDNAYDSTDVQGFNHLKVIFE